MIRTNRGHLFATSIAQLRSALEVVFVTILATAFAPFVGEDQRNYLLIALLLVLPFFLPLSASIHRTFLYFPGFLLFALLVNFFAGEGVRWTSFAYMMLFALSVSTMLSVRIKGREGVVYLSELLNRLLCAFAIIGVVQFGMLIIGMTALNSIVMVGPLRQNLLAVEPSHAALTVAILFLTQRQIVPLCFGSSNVRRRLVRSGSLALISIIFSGSSMGYAAALFILILLWPKQTLILCGFAVMFLPGLTGFTEFSPVRRLSSFVEALRSGDMLNVVQADHSGSMRLQPIFLYFESLNESWVGFWFGMGAGGQVEFFYGRVIGVADGWVSGFFPGILIEYGVVGFILFVVLVFPGGLVHIAPSMVVFFMLLLSVHWMDSQIFWLFIYLGYVVVDTKRTI